MTRVIVGLATLGLLLAAPAALASDGDYNGDGVVDLADGRIVEGAINTSAGDEGFVAEADLDGDGVISSVDLSLWMDLRDAE